jgi:alginate production protein
MEASLPTHASLIRQDKGPNNLIRRNDGIVADQTVDASAPDKLSQKSDISVKKGAAGLQRLNPLNQDNAWVKYLDADAEDPTQNHTSLDPSSVRLAQFALPQPAAEGESPVDQLPKDLAYEYGFGSESDIEYRKNPNLNNRVKDDFVLLAPELNGYVTWRPFEWMETTLELIIQGEFPALEQDRVVLPNGEIQFARGSQVTLLVDQAFVTFKRFMDPLNLTLGRRTFEDDRHWLYDASLDVALVTHRGKFRAEASYGQEALVRLNAGKVEVPDKVNTGIFYGEYRGIEDIKLAGYTIYREGQEGVDEGRPWLIGLRSLGHPTENFSYWADFAVLRGDDESGRNYSSAYGFDLGATYRFAGHKLRPNITLGYAFATGDRNPDDNENNAFRQTGLQSNETRFAGVSDFKIYGEALDPELSNLRIFTLGLGARPMRDVSVDFVYHRYWLSEIAEEIRNSPITALMNQIDTQLSRDVGDGLDIVLGIRNLFGVRRLGVDFRAGWFFPGKAFRTEKDGGGSRAADNGLAMLVKFWW